MSSKGTCMRMAGMTETKITEEKAMPGAGPVEPAGEFAAQKPNGAAARKVVDRVTEFGEETVGEVRCENPFVISENVNVYYGDNHAIRDVTLEIGRSEVIALIGPSGCGKSTYLRCLNRMNDSIESARVTGTITLDGRDIYSSDLDPVALRARVGMVFQKPNPFPKSIYDNVAYGPRIHGLAADRAELDDIVHTSLDRAGLLKEVKDRMDEPGTGLSGGQQQRLCIARTIAVNPEVILMDEPCSALDPIATARIEDLIDELSEDYTIVIVTHSMQQAARVSRRVAYFHLGRLVEVGLARHVFAHPQHPYTRLLLDTIPDITMTRRDREPVAGEVPNPINPPSGCTFHPRCSFANARCQIESPVLIAGASGVRVACHAVHEGRLSAASPGQRSDSDSEFVT